MDELAGEFEYLTKKIKKDSLIILNYDNPRIRKMSGLAKAEVKFFSTENITNEKNKNIWKASEIIKNGKGQTVKINSDFGEKEYSINHFGRHHINVLLVSLIIRRYFRTPYSA